MRSKEHLIAVLVLGEKLSEASYTSDDIDFLTAIGNQTSVAIENTFLYEELSEQERLKLELGIARRIQLASLPQSMPEIPGFDLSGTSLPAWEVGGDFFDFLQGDKGEFIAIIGDVSGKGTSAALYMAKVQGIFRSLQSVEGTFRNLFIRSNRLLRGDIEKSSFVTVLAATFDLKKRKAKIIRAGNLPLYRYRASDSRVEQIKPRGLALGMDDGERFDAELEERALPLRSGDVYLFVSDGVTEARNVTGEEFGEERLMKALAGSATLAAGAIQDVILRDVQAFVGDAQAHDDQTVVVVRVK
jgi:serine phosphatase RsbU (regulator of sigma subunit)